MANHPYSSTPAYQPEDNWRESALCAQVDAELFFPEKGGTTKEAKRICRSCPVQTQCLNEALTHGHRHGIWAGHTDRDLRTMRPTHPGGRPPINHAEAIRLHNTGMRMVDIARQLHCSPQAVSAGVRRAEPRDGIA